MKFIPLHTKNTAIVYKNSLCSSATLIVFTFIMLSVMIPVLLVSMLSPYSGISESRLLYEQPKVTYAFQYLFMGELDNSGNVVACSTFPYFNDRTKSWQKSCDTVKFSSDDHNHDSQMDRANFHLNFDDMHGELQSFDLVLIFEADLKHKCKLSPPAVLVHHVDIPIHRQQSTGSIVMKGHLKLTQNAEFICPFYGRSAKTHFRKEILSKNASSMEVFQFDRIQQRVKANPAYFELEISEIYYKPSHDSGLSIKLQMNVIQIGARYHLSVWERLGQFWLYFASFFGISFYVMNKTKDFLFGRHIIRAWEVIPWKKLY